MTVKVGLKCEECGDINYTTTKNSKTMTEKLTLRKHCRRDKKHTVTKIKKVTSGSTPEIGKFIDDVYKEVIVAGTFLASSIKVAEASKVIENSQRDINIAFVNELSKIFNLLEIDTNEVLEAASTKWNFLPFKPGLVGGHCIGVDPFYLAQKAQTVGYNPEIILAGRRMNDSMGAYVAQETVKLMINNDISVKNANILKILPLGSRSNHRHLIL